jgi:dephospho-CoA kinase
MQAIALTGPPRSGKDTAADYLVEKHGFSKVVMSDENGFELRKQGLEDDKMGRSRMGKELRERFGVDVIAKRSFERAEKSGFERVVFVGPRNIEEVDFFKKSVPGFKLVKVEAEKGKRFGRKSLEEGQSREKFFEREKWEQEKFGLGRVLDAADYTIENNSTIAELEKAIDELMQKL